MVLVDIPFLLIAVTTVLGLRLPSLRAWRVEVLAGASLLFAASVSDSIGDFACLVIIAATGWLLAEAVSRYKSRWLLISAIGCVVTEFLLARQILPRAPGLAIGHTIGLSYIMFRLIHLIVDAHGDELPPRLGLREVICYLFCYLTFLAGPIQQVQDFADQMRAAAGVTLKRAAVINTPAIVTGYFKFAVVAGAFFACFIWSQEVRADFPAFVLHGVGWLSFAGYLYFSFSGYTDVVRGIGGLIGLDLPANFDRPFAAANFLDFWSRWHISLSEWFKLYVFNPVVKAMISPERPGLVPYLGAAGFFITFFLMGLWHGISLRFALYGVCLGAGVSINKLYQYQLQKRLGRSRVSALKRNSVYAAAARALALGFFITALGFLWIAPQPADPVTIATWTEGAVVVVAVVLMFSLIGPALARVTAMVSRRQGMQGALCATQLVITLAYLVLLQGPVPPLLYEFF